MKDQTIAALRLALELIQDAMENHIYDAENGEEPGEDCAYLQGCRVIEQALADLGAPVSN